MRTFSIKKYMDKKSKKINLKRKIIIRDKKDNLSTNYTNYTKKKLVNETKLKP